MDIAKGRERPGKRLESPLAEESEHDEAKSKQVRCPCGGGTSILPIRLLS